MTIAAYAPVVYRLTTATGNVSYCGNRVYPVLLPQEPVLPAQTYQIISTDREHAMGIDPGHVHARLQVDIYDTTYLGTVSGAKHVREALDRWRGLATGVVVQDIYVAGERDAYVEPLEGGGRTVWRRTMDFILHYEEDPPRS